MLNKTNIMAEFLIIGDDFSPSQITQRLSISPTREQIRGGKIENRPKELFYKESCWILATDYEESYDINNQLRQLITKLQKHEDDLITLRKELSLKYKFGFVINIYQNETPGIYIDSKVIEFANKISAEFDFDIYIF